MFNYGTVTRKSFSNASFREHTQSDQTTCPLADIPLELACDRSGYGAADTPAAACDISDVNAIINACSDANTR